MVKNKAQIWVETVLYTLIGISLIALVLTFATPKINEFQDKLVIEQSIETMQQFGKSIDSVADSGIGTRRNFNSFNLKRGELIISNGDPLDNKAELVLEGLTYAYTQPTQMSTPSVTINEVKVSFDNVKVYTQIEPLTKTYRTTIVYSPPIKFDSSLQLRAAGTPYRLSIEKSTESNEAVISIKELTS
jgi:type II secretory pathway pseudopilin PulG